MGATPVGYLRWRGTDAGVAAELTTSPAEASAANVETRGDTGLDESSAVLLADGEVIAREEVARLQRWSNFRASVFSGLGVATVWTLNAVFSQPIAGYDYLTARLYRSRIGAGSGRKSTL